MKQFRRSMLFLLLLITACQRPETPTAMASEQTPTHVVSTGIPTQTVPTSTAVPTVEPAAVSPSVLSQEYLFGARFPTVSADGTSGAFWQKSEHAERWYLGYWHDGDILRRQVTNLMVHEGIVELDSLVMSPDGMEVAYLVLTDLSHSPNHIIVVYNIEDGTKREYMPTNDDYYRMSLKFTSNGYLTWVSLNQKQWLTTTTEVYVWDTVSDVAGLILLSTHGDVFVFDTEGYVYAFGGLNPAEVVFNDVESETRVNTYVSDIAIRPGGMMVGYTTGNGAFVFNQHATVNIFEKGDLLEWSPDGIYLAIGVMGDGVYVYNMANRTLQQVVISKLVNALAFANNVLLVDTEQGVEIISTP